MQTMRPTSDQKKEGLGPTRTAHGRNREDREEKGKKNIILKGDKEMAEEGNSTSIPILFSSKSEIQ